MEATRCGVHWGASKFGPIFKKGTAECVLTIQGPSSLRTDFPGEPRDRTATMLELLARPALLPEAKATIRTRPELPQGVQQRRSPNVVAWIYWCHVVAHKS